MFAPCRQTPKLSTQKRTNRVISSPVPDSPYLVTTSTSTYYMRELMKVISPSPPPAIVFFSENKLPNTPLHMDKKTPSTLSDAPTDNDCSCNGALLTLLLLSSSYRNATCHSYFSSKPSSISASEGLSVSWTVTL